MSAGALLRLIGAICLFVAAVIAAGAARLAFWCLSGAITGKVGA